MGPCVHHIVVSATLRTIGLLVVNQLNLVCFISFFPINNKRFTAKPEL